MSVTTGDFNQDISDLTKSNDPLGLHSTIEPIKSLYYQGLSHYRGKNTASNKGEGPLHDVILHYFKLNFTHINRNADGKNDQTKSKNLPTLQVNNPTISHSFSSDNFIRNTIF